MDLISAHEATELLGVSLKTFRSLVRQGFLRTVRPDGSKLNDPALYDEAEVADLLEARSKKVDLPTVASMARRSLMSSRQLERAVTTLLEVIGASIPLLSLDDEDVTALYIKIEDALTDTEQLSARQIVDWARVFYAMGEEYLWNVWATIEDVEPWRKPLALAEKLASEAPRSSFNTDKNMEQAYGYLEMSRRNLRNVCYFYIRNQCGERRANKEMPITMDVHDEVLNFAFIEYNEDRPS